MRICFPMFALPLVFLFSGCGGSDMPLSDVSGAVTFNGEPAIGAGVRFTPLSGERASEGQVDQDGNYRLIYSPSDLGAIIGEHNVFVQYNGKLLNKKIAVEDSGACTLDLELNEFVAAR